MMWTILAILATCGLLMACSICKACRETDCDVRPSQQDVPTRIDDIVQRATADRKAFAERQEARHEELCWLLGYSPNSNQGAELLDVIYWGEPLENVLKKIMQP